MGNFTHEALVSLEAERVERLAFYRNKAQVIKRDGRHRNPDYQAAQQLCSLYEAEHPETIAAEVKSLLMNPDAIRLVLYKMVQLDMAYLMLVYVQLRRHGCCDRYAPDSAPMQDCLTVLSHYFHHFHPVEEARD